VRDIFGRYDKGIVVYRASVPSSSGVKATLSENWLVYHYYEKEASCYRMVSVELYKGEKADDKTKRYEFSALVEVVQSFLSTT
jgi:hypothetical protein